MKKLLSLAAIGLAFLFTQSPVAFADGHHECFHKKMHKMVEKLKLSADQKTKIDAIVKKAKEDIKPKKEELHKLAMQANDEFKANTMTEAKIDSIVSQKVQLLSVIIKTKMMERLEISQILTKEQQAKLQEMFKKCETKKEKKED